MDYLTHFQLHLESLRPPHKSSGGLHAYASEAGNCDRQLYYRLLLQPGTDPDAAPDLATSTIAYHIGNNLHDEWQAMMAKLHPNNFTGEVKWQHPAAPEVATVSGRCDGIYKDDRGKRIALEIKSMSGYRYKVAMKSGRPYTRDAMQAALSMYVLEADEVQLVYLCKDWIDVENEPMCMWTYPVLPSVAIHELDRQTRILRTVQTRGPIPARTARGEIIDNIDKDPECRYCVFYDLCELQGE